MGRVVLLQWRPVTAVSVQRWITASTASLCGPACCSLAVPCQGGHQVELAGSGHTLGRSGWHVPGWHSPNPNCLKQTVGGARLVHSGTDPHGGDKMCAAAVRGGAFWERILSTVQLKWLPSVTDLRVHALSLNKYICCFFGFEMLYLYLGLNISLASL